MKAEIAFDENAGRLTAARMAGDGATSPRIKIVPFGQIGLSAARRYLVKGLVPYPGLLVIWGAPKTGKSYFAFDMLLRVSLGWEYRGRRVHPGAVVYCSFEGASGIAARAEAFRQRWLNDMDAGEVPFCLVPDALDLVRDHVKLIEAIRIALDGVNPVAVCLDTLNRSLAGSESRDEDMAAYIRACDAIREAFNCAVVVIHHCGIEARRPRGHTSLTGACDAQIKITRDGDGNIMAVVEHMKDGPEGETVTSTLEQVEVGTDEDGEPITSCVVLEAETATADTSLRGPTLTANHKTMLAILVDAGRAGLTIEEWNIKAREAGIGVKRKATLTDVRLALKTKKLVYEFEDIWKLTSKG